MKHILGFNLFENLKEIISFKEFPDVDSFTDFLYANNILDSTDITDEDLKLILKYFNKAGFYPYKVARHFEHYMNILINDSEEYVGCHIEIRKHKNDWYEILFIRKKKNPIGDGYSYTQTLEFNRWLCNETQGIFRLLKKLINEYPFLSGKTTNESLDLESISGFTEINTEEDFEFLENRLKYEKYNIEPKDIDFILKICNRFNINIKHEIKVHSGREGLEKRILIIYFNIGSTTIKINIRRIPNDYFYIFTTHDKEKKYFLCDDLGGVSTLIKYLKKHYLST